MSPTFRPRPGGRRRGAVAAALLAAALTTGLATAPGAAASTGSKQLNITMQAQTKSNWCWAATGNTIATWYGRGYSQNAFCDAAFGYPQGTSCPNDQATLADDQNAYDWMGIDPGSYIRGRIGYGTLQSEIDNNRPVQTRIQWSSGGGHMEVLYGYDTSNNWVYWGDPWPSDYRYNWADYGYYAGNDQFTWTHTLYGIGA
ncbi:MULTISPECIES: papain-like cysteine protease family protein [Streptomycetaceae]|uniref:Papain like cysteine protease AvrRpt2 n=1 Tax=Streptantibioticus cattleyicolor (strain ATCC 35852 / DSM 46488 / JCM 4925 / NBRC 14057 / NRRL 8057) TaxID=1003195 RepID=F8JUJ7_STREN|nr:MULTISPECIES: papain-like cysteine protease family protein [Streptomycetaceae]AEW95621.1 hypothetical protein SCATT_32500 [Streptantibioticus cattleyicolor NRRL 8057 = DSM 46488]MYS60166.1 hypothetical protein [Streptomyces sp. SID5468]CCB75956.1 conserved exported protein of unknown function [Streptantibioticus cattleyicolor NRRL 8057 = DSM 46488]